MSPTSSDKSSLPGDVLQSGVEPTCPPETDPTLPIFTLHGPEGDDYKVAVDFVVPRPPESASHTRNALLETDHTASEVHSNSAPSWQSQLTDVVALGRKVYESFYRLVELPVPETAHGPCRQIKTVGYFSAAHQSPKLPQDAKSRKAFFHCCATFDGFKRHLDLLSRATDVTLRDAWEQEYDAHPAVVFQRFSEILNYEPSSLPGFDGNRSQSHRPTRQAWDHTDEWDHAEEWGRAGPGLRRQLESRKIEATADHVKWAHHEACKVHFGTSFTEITQPILASLEAISYCFEPEEFNSNPEGAATRSVRRIRVPVETLQGECSALLAGLKPGDHNGGGLHLRVKRILDDLQQQEASVPADMLKHLDSIVTERVSTAEGWINGALAQAADYSAMTTQERFNKWTSIRKVVAQWGFVGEPELQRAVTRMVYHFDNTCRLMTAPADSS